MLPVVCDLHTLAFSCEWLQFVSVFGFFRRILSGAARRFPLGFCSNIGPCSFGGSVGGAAGMLYQLVLVVSFHSAPRTRVRTS